jgi:transcriptional regulator with XRE-family HTH domain
MNKDFKALLAQIKAKYGLNQEQIAEELGVSRPYLSEIVGGRSPYSDSLKKKIESIFPLDDKKEPDIVIPSELAKMFSNMSETILKQEKNIERLIALVEGKAETKQNVG